MNKKLITVIYLLLSITNVILTAILMDMFFGSASDAPEWVKSLAMIYIVIPMGHSSKLLIENFSKK
ncbi:hypothetical protein [Agarilytica rhodophyticola]|uniref:hypothetical protein n=1 Tax=Agarilytica rhodophyticola TaxID=1737490 RepID=UPI000B341888|nr:hypothetical protein [Agarilytica rhodophyticola]